MLGKTSTQLYHWRTVTSDIFNAKHHGGFDPDVMKRHLRDLDMIAVDRGIQEAIRKVRISLDAAEGPGPASRLDSVRSDFSVLRDNVVLRVARDYEAEGD